MIGTYLTTVFTGTAGDTLTLGEDYTIIPLIPIGIILFLLLKVYLYGIGDLMDQDKDKE
jgi:hypothetical protein